MSATTRFLVTLAVLATVPALAHAQGQVRLSWFNCSPYVQNADVGDIDANFEVKQVLSITGEDRTNRGHLSFVEAGPNVPDAWRFDADGCPRDGSTGPSLSIVASDAAVSPFSCPAFKGDQAGPGSNVTYDGTKLKIELSQVYVGTFSPVAGTRYTLWQLTYPLGRSIFFPPGDPAHCPGVEQPLCFQLRNPQILIDVGDVRPLGISEDFVTWQDPNNEQRCPDIVPAETSTWGRVKGLYR